MSLKDLLSDFFWLRFLSMTFSYSLRAQKFVIIPMITPYLNLGKVLTKLSKNFLNDFLILEKWFFNNFLVLNSDKCHFVTLWTPNTLANFKFENIKIKNSVSEKLLGVIIDNKLDFTEHLDTVCKNANLKFSKMF